MKILTAQRLERAAAIVEERWTQGTVAHADGCVCAWGAIVEACGRRGSTTGAYSFWWSINPKGRAALNAAFPGSAGDAWNIVEFNDKEGRRKATVARRLRKAAAILRGDK